MCLFTYQLWINLLTTLLGQVQFTGNNIKSPNWSKEIIHVFTTMSCRDDNSLVVNAASAKVAVPFEKAIASNVDGYLNISNVIINFKQSPNSYLVWELSLSRVLAIDNLIVNISS